MATTRLAARLAAARLATRLDIRLATRLATHIFAARLTLTCATQSTTSRGFVLFAGDANLLEGDECDVVAWIRYRGWLQRYDTSGESLACGARIYNRAKIADRQHNSKQPRKLSDTRAGTQ
jgi:hypothetical protein